MQNQQINNKYKSENVQECQVYCNKTEDCFETFLGKKQQLCGYVVKIHAHFRTYW